MVFLIEYDGLVFNSLAVYTVGLFLKFNYNVEQVLIEQL